MIEFLRHSLGLCGENHGLLYWIFTGGVLIVLTPFYYIRDLLNKIRNK